MHRKLRQAALGVATFIASVGYVSTCVSHATAEETAGVTALSYQLECDTPAPLVVASARFGSGVLAAPQERVRVPAALRRQMGTSGGLCNYSSWCSRNTASFYCVNKKGYCSNCCVARRPATPMLMR